MSEKRIVELPQEFKGKVIEHCDDCPFYFNDGEYSDPSCTIGGYPQENIRVGTSTSYTGFTYSVFKVVIPEDCPLSKSEVLDGSSR
jgi:predicted Zn-ribbon and HTH transcriptional regulator